MKITTPRSPRPMSRMDWHRHYTARFNKTGDGQALHLAMWYLLLALAEQDGALS